MENRRHFIVQSCTLAVAGVLPTLAQAQNVKKLVMVHGRAQGGRDIAEIRNEWLNALKAGANKAGLSVPTDIEIVFPFYGDRLDELIDLVDVSTASNITAKGNDTQDDYLRFQVELANDFRGELGVTDEQINAEYGDNDKEKGPLNWEWVQAILKAIDKHSEGITQAALETFTRDVFLYLNRNVVRRQIDKLLSDVLDDQPTIVVGHSLGSVVCYNVLKTAGNAYKVPHFVTIGCPLGIRAIRSRLSPIKYPNSVRDWSNFYDERDVVALHPLDDQNFLVSPKINNFGRIINRTDNRHGISGYLDDRRIARAILNPVN